ncbi:hypothetical protein RJ640_024130 [Escallonia rubra]|uniref:Uncharacterized protein n=1 Tax=Escallonia rubra TaxID=112253 RepID=A0AA88R119_9ASTE|nr:hypothetical protein RJ640_024130 [Escallonia rubra]
MYRVVMHLYREVYLRSFGVPKGCEGDAMGAVVVDLLPGFGTGHSPSVTLTFFTPPALLLGFSLNRSNYAKAELCESCWLGVVIRRDSDLGIASACYGNQDNGVLIAAASDPLWNNGAICGKTYTVTCTGATNAVPHPCTARPVCRFAEEMSIDGCIQEAGLRSTAYVLHCYLKLCMLSDARNMY